MGSIVCLLIWSGLVAATPAQRTTSNDDPNLLSRPNLLVHFESRDNLDRLISHLNLSKPDETDDGDEIKDWETVFFHLFTPENGFDKPVKVFAHNLTAQVAKDAKFWPYRKTVVASHGWQSDVSCFTPLAKAYLENPELSNVNVLVLDWSVMSADWTYVFAASYVPHLGNKLGDLLNQVLVQEIGQSPDLIHTIGHSLGAHVAGHVGRNIEWGCGKKISRVTGLDPAKPWFDLADENARILKTDAQLVDIIHTNSGVMQDGGLSFTENLGHIDFYPNGGEHQPGCVPECTWNCRYYDLDDMVHGCSHGRSCKFYFESAEAANNDNGSFKSFLCNGEEDFKNHICETQCTSNCTHMGERLERSHVVTSRLREDPITSTGYYLETNAEAPYSKS